VKLSILKVQRGGNQSRRNENVNIKTYTVTRGEKIQKRGGRKM